MNNYLKSIFLIAPIRVENLSTPDNFHKSSFERGALFLFKIIIPDQLRANPEFFLSAGIRTPFFPADEKELFKISEKREESHPALFFSWISQLLNECKYPALINRLSTGNL